MPKEPIIDWKAVRKHGGSYPQPAYDFVREGLMHTVKLVHGDDGAADDSGDDHSRHVSGQQLCFGLKDFAIRRYGMLAKTVLNHWLVFRTDDFGKIVFAMIDCELMRKTDDDSFEDFQGVFDFDEAFGRQEPSGQAV
ncbi:MAG: hypothetical protein H6811_05685 [Phycisphaeraceae bacterium]|nr:hypothetical protein [Phycisphaeraceae bacterium]